MKLVYVSEFLNEDSQAAAFARRSRSLAQQLSYRGFTVTQATTERRPAAAPADTVVRLRPSVSSRKMGGRLRVRVSATFPIARSVSKLLRRERPDRLIVSFHDPQYGLLVTLTGRLSGLPILFDAQDSWIVLEHEHDGAIRNRLRRTLERTALRLSTHVTTVSPTLRDLLIQEYGLAANKVHVVFNAADPLPTSSSLRKDIDLIHLGSPRQNYDTLSLIDAIALLRSSGLKPRLVFLGCTDEQYVHAVKRKVLDLGLQDQVAFEPPVPLDSVPAWLARSTIGVQTLRDDPIYRCAIGVKIFEYIATGLPVAHMGPSDGETAKLVSSTGCGVAASTVSGFADALGGVLADPERIRALGAIARAVARDHTWEASARTMERLLVNGTRG